MKIKILAILTLLPLKFLSGQDLPRNKITGLVAIMDSMQVSSEIKPYEMRQIVREWQKKVNDKTQLLKIFNYKTGEKSAYFYCSPGFERGKDKFTDKGTLTYSGGKKVLGQYMRDISCGEVSFSFNYEIRSGHIVFEFTDLLYTWANSGQVKGRFEDEKTTKPFAVGITANNRKTWEYIKREYVDRFEMLMQDLKSYYNSYNPPIVPSTPQPPSGVTYQNYELIKKDMTYEQVKAIIGADGKEMNNITQTLMGKEITTRVVGWYDATDQSKAIIVTFRNEKLAIKQQQNL